jgi:hypothetical protein
LRQAKLEIPKNDTFADMRQKIRQIEISAEQRKQNESDFERYNSDADFVDVYLSQTTGGLKARHKRHKRNTKGDIKFGLNHLKSKMNAKTRFLKLEVLAYSLTRSEIDKMAKLLNVWML